MSRESNHLQRYIAESLAEREACRKWIREAEARSPWITVTERDWEQFGHMPVGEWLMDNPTDDEDPRDDWEDSWDEEIYDYCSHCGRMFDIIGGCSCNNEEFEEACLLDDWYEETIEEYGDRRYPMAHVRAAREYLERKGDYKCIP